jgi:DNA-binding transcriptional regulator/RsmH inhibitor MraZ
VVSTAGSESTPPVVETPRGTYTGRVDPKGRLKLPTDFKEYFEANGHKKFFITTVDAKQLYIYPISIWRENERRLEDALASEEDVAAADSVRFISNMYGADVTMDGEGRMLVPQELRKDLGFADAQVWMYFERGKIIGYNEIEYNRRRDEAKHELADKVRRLTLKGLK